ncbi:MAG: GNAT family N-acetyltransferase [Oscillospiraceae bacterium]|jgi:L-amino acid N-acyltransferase YncA|nr:GNAT family N-acetyltransferase [Oscillospiraceae bacterium]MDD3262053.1 GNAT family N-acetyltransferase [Oscillospiraceae bacterium]
MNKEFEIRTATQRDAQALLEIYAPYVKTTAVTFEYRVPSAAEFAGRIVHVEGKYPYLLAQAGGEILGYAYAGAFHAREAYDWAVETSIYVNKNKKRMGIGSRLYGALEAALKEQGVLNLNACIAFPQREDAYLTKDSAVFHEKMGFRFVGEFHECGYKFDRWYNMIWMEKQIGPHTAHQPPIKDFAEIRAQIRQKYGIL